MKNLNKEIMEEFEEMSNDPISCYEWKEIKSFIRQALKRKDEEFVKMLMKIKIHKPIFDDAETINESIQDIINKLRLLSKKGGESQR